MSRLTILTKDKAQVTMESLYQDLERRIVASPPGLCPVDLTRSFIKMCLAQSCGKCVPCRVGLRQLARLFDNVLDGEANEETVENIKLTAEGIYYSADCAIGYEAAKLALKSVDGCIDDFESHIHNGFCSCNSNQPVACVKSCPAGVDIPGYIALVQQGRYADAVRLIRKDNPMPSVCAFICEHPCENRCKRTLIDAPVNIRGLKKMAVDSAGVVDVPECGEPTGKKVAIIGGGPAGYTAAEAAGKVGLSVVLFEKQSLGGVCLNEGCIPTKTLLYSAKTYDGARHASKYAVSVPEVSFDLHFPTVLPDKSGNRLSLQQYPHSVYYRHTV